MIAKLEKILKSIKEKISDSRGYFIVENMQKQPAFTEEERANLLRLHQAYQRKIRKY